MIDFDLKFDFRVLDILVCVVLDMLVGVPVAVFADDYKPVHPPLARSLTSEQVDMVVQNAPRDANVSLPGWYAKQTPLFRSVGTNALAHAAVPALEAVIEDSRKNIPELEGLTDIQVAQLYLAQMAKPVEELQRLAPTNSMEYLIGAGMRQDLLKAKEAK